MVIALVFAGIRNHFFGTTLEAHANITPRAMDLIAARPPDHRRSTFHAKSNSVLFYVFAEQRIFC
jgi:hypothetical protein